jgi:hypothetical protein
MGREKGKVARKQTSRLATRRPLAAPLAHIPNLGYSIPLLRAVERYRI